MFLNSIKSPKRLSKEKYLFKDIVDSGRYRFRDYTYLDFVFAAGDTYVFAKKNDKYMFSMVDLNDHIEDAEFSLVDFETFFTLAHKALEILSAYDRVLIEAKKVSTH